MRRILLFVLAIVWIQSHAQVDTTFIYDTDTPYGSLDIRIAKSPTNYYYLQENKTFSFRESSPGVKTDAYRDMTSWDSSPYMEGNLREKNGAADNFVMNYRMLMPGGYDADYSPGYPMILMLHGLGERGNCWEEECYHADPTYTPQANNPPAPTSSDFELLNNDHQLATGGNVHLLARNAAGTMLPNDPGLPERSFPGFIVFPQNLNGWTNLTTQDAIRIVRLLIKKYNIDPNRIYIHGLSNGGHGVYETIKRAPWLFAAALTMSPIDDGFITVNHVEASVAHIPLWVFQGGQDHNPTPGKTENMIKKFRDAGMVVRYTKYPNLGHGTWGTAYQEPDFFSWMLGKNNANIHAFAGNPTICNGESATLELPEGFLAYQWEKDGAVISGADEATYEATTAGTYRARFSRVAAPSESEWNQWSEPVQVTMGAGLPQAEIRQYGTVLLKDLNNFGNAQLESEGDFAHYYWFKNGLPVDFTGDQDDTIKFATITPAMGKGAYTLVVANFDNCQSPVSDAKYLFFNNEAPTNITAPSGFSADVDGVEVDLSWTDESSNENGFEIWRRRQTGASTFTPWEMAVLTSGNESSFHDSGLYPETTYQYKIRGVSNTGRSQYTPSTESLIVDTGADTEAPSAPQNLTATMVGIQKFRLSWSPATDNSVLEQYYIEDGTNSIPTGSLDTTFYLTDLALNDIYTLTVKAADLSGNLSEPSNSFKVSTYVAGLFYEHSTGLTEDLDLIDWSTPEFTGLVETFTLSPKTQEDYFNFRFDGFLWIVNPGSYEFRTTSDDGSRLKLNDEVIVENNGVHGAITVESSAKNLNAGYHRIMAEFFDFVESDSLSVEYKGPDTNDQWMEIGGEALKSAENAVMGTEDPTHHEFVLIVYPNPSRQDNLNIRVQTMVNAPVQIQLIDPVGRSLVTEVFNPAEVGESIRLAPEGILSDGLYIVVATQGNVTARKRVIIRSY